MSFTAPSDEVEQGFKAPKDEIEEAPTSATGEILPSIARGANVGVGQGVQALATLGERISGGSVPGAATRPETYGLPEPGAPPGIPKLAPPEESQRSQDAFRAAEATRFAQGLQANPLYKAGQHIEETGAQIPEPKTLVGKASEAAGGILPLVASAELAPATMLAQGFGSQFQSQYDDAKKNGASDVDALNLATQRAVLVGGTEAAAWAILPPFLKTQINKVTGKIGAAGVAAFTGRRIAGALETGATAGAAKAAENVETGKPITQDVGSAALGGAAIGAFMPQPGIKFKPREEVPTPAPRQVKGLLTTAPMLVTPEGDVVDSSALSPKERTEFERAAEAQSRQTPSGQQRVTGTVAAGLNLGDTPAKWLFKSNGTYWYKRDGEWRTDAPTKSFNVRRLDANNPAHGQMIDTLEQQLKTASEKQLQRQGGKTETQQKIEDITGVSRAQSSIQDVAPDLTMREIWESRENRRFAFPLSQYGPKRGPMSMSQRDYLKSFSNFARTADVGKIQRLYSTLTGAPPKNAFENSVISMLKERLGVKQPPVEQTKLTEGGQNAPNQEQKPGGVPPERGGDGSGGPPTQASPGSSIQPAAEVRTETPETPVKPAAEDVGLTDTMLNGRPLPAASKAMTKEYFKSLGDKLNDPKTISEFVHKISASQTEETRIAQTESAYQLGAHLRDLSPEEALPKIKALYDGWNQIKTEGREMAKAGDIRGAMILAGSNQFPREAWQSAIGELSGKDAIPEGAGHGAPLPIEVNEQTGEVKLKEKALEIVKGTAEKAAEDEVKRQRKLAEDLMREKFSNEHDYAQAFPEARYTWDQMVKEVERGLKLGKSEEEIRKAFNPANGMTSHPDRLINKVNSVPSDPEKLVAAREGRTKTPSEIAAEEAKAAGKQPTEEETDYAKWKQAESDKPILMAQLRHGTTADGRALTAAEKEALPGKIAEANKVLEAMGKKYNEPSKSFGKYMAKKSGTPGLPKDTTPRGEALNEGDRVVGTVDGKEEVGIVRQFAGRLQVVSPDGSRVISENVVGFKKDARPTTPAASKPYEAADLRTAVKQYSKVKADFKINPSMEQEALAAINKLRADAASRGVDPDSPAMNSETEAHKIRMIQETVADAAKYQHFLDKGHKNYSEAGNAEKLDTVRKWLDIAQKPVESGFRAKAEEITKKLDALKANKKPSDLALFGVTQKLWDGGIEAAKTTIRAGGSTLDAIAAAARYIRSQIGNAWKEFDFKKWLGEQFPAREGEEAPAKKDFIKTWITDSVAPSVRGTHDATKAAINLFVDWFAPTTKAASGDLDTLMESKGYKDKLMLRAAHALSQAREAMGGMKRKDQIDFVDRVKRGKAQPTPELQATADLLRKWDDRLYALASKYSPDLPYLANHLRVLWKVIPGTAGKSAYEIEQMMSKRPWRGSRGFILRHTLEDMSEGIEKGGVPVTYNPIEMFMLHAQDVTKFVSANRAWENLKDSGRAVFVERGDHPPDENWSRINDTIAKQYFKKVETTTEGGKKVTKPGEWYVNKDTARLINNYLSRDYVRENAAGRGLLAFKNISTAIELGASPFHAAFVTNESISSSMALAIQKGLRGDVRGAASSLWDAASGLKGPLGNIPGLPEPVRNVLETRISKLGRLTAEYAKSPKEFEANYPQAFAWLNKNYPQFKEMVNDLFTGGGMVEMHDDYKVGAAQGFESAFKNNNYVTVTAKAIPALNQFLLRPIFQEYIPRLKLGHFMREYAFNLERRAGDLESGKITRAQLARETWAFVDDRFGELNWDNLYWNRTFKSGNQLAFRSVTWKLGNIRGFGKGIRDIGQLGADVARFKIPTVTLPMAWLFGMAVTTSVMSTILSKVFTKKYPWELAENSYDLIKNLTFPRVDATDPSQRVSTPGYWKDAVHFIHSPYDYVRSSMTGEWGRLWDIWNNKDFYGTQIYNPDDPFWQRQEDKAIHLIPLPFSISSQLAAERSGSSKTVSHLGQAGFTKAPYYMSHTPAELEASELMQQQLPQGARTRENAEKAINVHKAVQAIKRGDMTIDQAAAQGLIDERKYKQVENMVEQSYLVTQIKRSSMTPQDALKIWHKASKKEREDIRDAIELKIVNSRSLEPEDRERLLDELDKSP